MSSLAAARADNFYYPPEWTPNQGSLNKFHGQHALRKRARKLDEGILIIRFEMPFKIWCGGCNDSMIAKGVRFNAEKKQVGNYYSTKIWSFTMKSPCCKHQIVIQTDPKNCDYVIISGARRKIEEFDLDDVQTIEVLTDEERAKLYSDSFYRLEHEKEDLRKKKEAEPGLVIMKRKSDARYSEDYALNRALRAKLRPEKKRVAEEEAASRKLGLGLRLLPASREDAAAAAGVKFFSSNKFEKNRKDKRALINAASIFSGSSVSNTKRLELEAKRRKINADAASKLLTGAFIPSSWSQSSVPSSRHKRTSGSVRRF